MKDKITTLLDRKELEKQFLEWAEARDDDWWEDQARIDIWDFRVMLDFFMPTLETTYQLGREDKASSLEKEIKLWKKRLGRANDDLARGYRQGLNNVLEKLKSK